MVAEASIWVAEVERRPVVAPVAVAGVAVAAVQLPLDLELSR